MNKKLKALIIGVILFIISATVIIINGNTYTINYKHIQGISDVNSFSISLDDDNIVSIVDKKIENETLKITIKSKQKGKTYVDIDFHADDESISNFSISFSIYVHKFGVITFNEYMGDCNGSIIIPIAFAIWLLYVLFLLITSYKDNIKSNMYQYKNIVYLGMIVFIIFAVVSQLMAIYGYNGIISTVEEIISMFSISILLFPLVFIVSILVIISNISLIRKEGFNFRNFLGIVLGAFLCISTVLPEITYNVLYSASWIDIHNQNGIGLYIYNFVEAMVKIIIAYIECILIGTVVMGIKAARHVPTFDKDAIIILGCQIKKDGTLTNLLKGRVDKAIDFGKMQKEKTGKSIIFVPSGGKGNDEVISEAQAMKNYLLDQGIKEDSILVDDKSKNTFENIKFSNSLIKEKIKNAQIAFSTTNYHVFRAGNIASEQGLYFEGIGAKTKTYFWINAFIREFIATLVNEKKKHIAVIISIILFAALLIMITYLNNNV